MKKYLVLFLMNLSSLWDHVKRWFAPGGYQPVDMTQIQPCLFLGGFFSEWPKTIDCVINMAEEDRDDVPWWCYGFLWCPRPDLPGYAQTPKELQSLVSVICLWLDLGKRVLVHCDAGNNRSATVVIAYVMYSMQLTTTQAIAYVKAKRPSVGPHEWQVQALREYEATLTGQSP